MAVATEIARLARTVDEFVAGVEHDLNGRAGLSAAERQNLRAEIERSTRLLDELRGRLSP